MLMSVLLLASIFFSSQNSTASWYWECLVKFDSWNSVLWSLERTTLKQSYNTSTWFSMARISLILIGLSISAFSKLFIFQNFVELCFSISVFFLWIYMIQSPHSHFSGVFCWVTAAAKFPPALSPETPILRVQDVFCKKLFV